MNKLDPITPPPNEYQFMKKLNNVKLHFLNEHTIEKGM